MAAHRVAYLRVQLIERLGFGEDRFARSLGDIAALGRFFNDKDDFVLGTALSL